MSAPTFWKLTTSHFQSPCLTFLSPDSMSVIQFGYFFFMELLQGPHGTNSSSEDYVKSHMLNSTWAPTTLKHYNTGVAKLMVYALERRVNRSRLLPIQPDVLYDFVEWASPYLIEDMLTQRSSPIKSTTV